MTNTTIVQESEWCKAATLSERVATTGSCCCDPGSPPDMARAQRRLRRWKTQPPFDTGDYFFRRLTVDGTDEDELLRLLSEGNGGLTGESPLWLEDLAKAFDAPASPTPPADYDLPYFQENVGFLGVIQPVINQALERLRTGVLELQKPGTTLPFNPDAVSALLSVNLLVRLLAMLNRTLILELNVARLEGNLQGDSPEARFQSFLLRLRDKEIALRLLREYPVLTRQIMMRTNQWVTSSLEFLQSLCADWAAIRTTFFPDNDPGTLVEVNGGVGDYHRSGRSVLICKFSSGCKLVYKPRPLALDRHFQELLHWVNQRSRLHFRSLKILDRTSYGWIEFVEAAPCKSQEEVQRFYERQGGYLALLFALEASDFHFENVIAAGEHPVLIDLEALYHPRFEAGPQQQSEEAVTSALNFSVLRVGLLPQRTFGNATDQESTGIDTSGLGGSGGQLTLESVPWLEATGTDTMHVARKRILIPGSKNQPYMAKAEIKVQDYSDAIVSGFATIYETLLQHRKELLAPDGPLTPFADDQVRVVVRPTEIYALLLRESFHPDLLRDALDRDRFLDHLWAAVRDCPDLEKVIDSERNDLLNGDIPIFTTRPSSYDLWSSTNQSFKRFFQQSGLDRVRQRLQRLSKDDLTRQVWFVRASLTSLTLGEAMAAKTANRENCPPREPATPERLLAAAVKVGDRLMELALWGKNDVSWVGIGLVNERAWSVLPLGGKLYDGLPGIILFLAYLASLTSKNDYARLARTALGTLLRQVKEPAEMTQSPEMKMIGGFSGLGGIIYVLCHLSALWGENELLDEAEKIVDKLPALIPQDNILDIIGGSAGCLAALVALYHLRPSERVLAVAIQCGDHLVNRAQPMQQGSGWLVSAIAPTPLTGFSHGAAGIAWALTELASLTGEERFQRAALEGIAYEHSLFVPEAGNWPDLRRDVPADSDGDSIPCGKMWCHGAPGIGLARLKMLKHLNGQALTKEELRKEAEIALQTTLQTGFGFNHCLCHGDLGNLETLLQASLILDAPLWKKETAQLAATVLESIERDGWLCGTPANVETPGLLTGISGIGFELLRLADSARVPSVLCLEAPILGNKASETQPIMARDSALCASDSFTPNFGA